MRSFLVGSPKSLTGFLLIKFNLISLFTNRNKSDIAILILAFEDMGEK